MARCRRGVGERPGERGVAAQRQHEAADAGVVQQRLPAAGQAGAHRLVSGGPSQSRRRRHRAVVGGEADQHRVGAVALAHELADVPLAVVAHLGLAGVAEVRVVRPHGDARRRAAVAAEVGVEGEQRLDHVRVAQVPRRHPAAEHRAVVVLGVLHQPRVLLGGEALVGVGAVGRRRRRRGASARRAGRRRRPRSSRSAPARRRSRRPACPRGSGRSRRSARGRARPPPGRCGRGRRARPRSSRTGCRGRCRRSRRAAPAGSAALCARSHSTKSRTTVLRHIQVGKRRKPASAASASASGGAPAASARPRT